MIDVSKGADDISKNAAISSNLNEYKGHTIYTVGVLSKEMMADAPDHLNKIMDIALGLTLASDLKIKAAADTGSADNAKLLADQGNGLKAMASGVGQSGGPRWKSF